MNAQISNPFEIMMRELAIIKNKLIKIEKMQNAPSVDPKQIGGMELAIEVTGLKKRTIYDYVHKGIIPHFKKQSKLFFARKDLEEWILSGKKYTIEDRINGLSQS